MAAVRLGRIAERMGLVACQRHHLAIDLGAQRRTARLQDRMDRRRQNVNLGADDMNHVAVVGAVGLQGAGGVLDRRVRIVDPAGAGDVVAAGLGGGVDLDSMVQVTFSCWGGGLVGLCRQDFNSGLEGPDVAAGPGEAKNSALRPVPGRARQTI